MDMTYLDVKTKSKRLRNATIASFLFVFIVLLISMVHSILYQPKVREVLFNMQGALYAPEDLGLTTQTEGQVKQALFETLRRTFSYNYLDFVQNEDYQKLVDKSVDTDLPDHRDLIKPFYDNEAHAMIVEQLLQAPWMDRFHQQRRKTKVSFLSPPMQETGAGFIKDQAGRLTISYVGSFMLSSLARGQKPIVYRITYRAQMERKAMIMDEIRENYYFAPMVPRNTFDWRVKELTWDLERRR